MSQVRTRVDPQTEKLVRMVQHLTDKHVGYMDALVLKYEVLEWEHRGELIEQPFPYLLIDFKY